jgi:hypothetical protein
VALAAFFLLPKSVNVQVAVALFGLVTVGLPIILAIRETMEKGGPDRSWVVSRHKTRFPWIFVSLLGLPVGLVIMLRFGITESGYLSPPGWLGFALILVCMACVGILFFLETRGSFF